MFHTPSLFHRFKILRKWSFSVLRRYARIAKPRFVVERRMGVLMVLDQRDKVDLNVLCGGAWEADRIEYLQRLVSAACRTRMAAAVWAAVLLWPGRAPLPSLVALVLVLPPIGVAAIGGLASGR